MPYESYQYDMPARYTAGDFCGDYGPYLRVSGTYSQYVQIAKGANHWNWKFRIANNLCATTALTVYTNKTTLIPGSILVTYDGCEVWNGYVSEYRGIFTHCLPLPYVSLTSSCVEAADNRAKMEFISKLNKARTGFQSGIFLGELRETLSMIRTPAKALRNGMSDYLLALKERRKGVRSARKLKRILSGTWLEYSFGWKPLIGDIEDGAKALAHIAEDLPFRQYVKGFSTWEEPYLPTRTNWKTEGLIKFSYDEVCRSEAKVVYRGHLGAQPSSDNVPDMLRWSGLTLDEFIPTFWELLPWSWAVDYFANVGDILTAWSAGTGNLRWCQKTTVTWNKRWTQNHQFYKPHLTDFPYPPGRRLGVFVPDRVEHASKTIHRAEYTGKFVPSFTWHLPGSPAKWTNLAAVGSQYAELIPYHKFCTKR